MRQEGKAKNLKRFVWKGKVKQMIKFGTGGWRAIIGDEFTKANIQLLSKALCDKMKAEGKADKGIVIGYDRRFLAKEAMQWAGEVFAAEGITAYLVNKSSPTPLIMFYVMKHELPYGMMVTASHNLFITALKCLPPVAGMRMKNRPRILNAALKMWMKSPLRKWSMKKRWPKG